MLARRRRIDLGRVVRRILALPLGARALHGCPCPPPVYDVETTTHEETADGERLRQLVQRATRAACDDACALEGGWRCDATRIAESDPLAPATYACASTAPEQAEEAEIDAGELPDAGDVDASPPPTARLRRVVRGRPAADLDRDLRALAEGAAESATCAQYCPAASAGERLESCSLSRTTLRCRFASTEKRARECAGGRAPAGLASLRSHDALDPVASYWRAMEHLERASVAAFEELASELLLLGAPSALVERARRAADDERRHTRACGAELRRLGVARAEVVRRPVPPRCLLALAEDNAREGCVRESFGALLAAVQARRAEDPRHRALFAAIARDETAHGQLAWDVHAWAVSVLGERAASVEAALDDELASLAAGGGADEALARLGLPGRLEHDALARAFAAEASTRQ